MACLADLPAVWLLQFFKPLNPVNVVIHFNTEGRASGECDVDFSTHEEASEAMKRDRASMRKSAGVLVHRYHTPNAMLEPWYDQRPTLPRWS